MAYDLEEQEQLADLKAFWNKYGNLLTWVLIIAPRFLRRLQLLELPPAHARRPTPRPCTKSCRSRSTDKDNAKVQRIAADIETKFGGTAYAQMAALAAAKGAFDANDLKTAKTQLQWVVEHGSDEYKSIAKLRLAGVLLDEKAYDEGLKLLATEFMPQFAGAVADRKGDILVAQNKLAEARTAYQAALAAMDKKNPGRQLVEVKLESIGGTRGHAESAGLIRPADASDALYKSKNKVNDYAYYPETGWRERAGPDGRLFDPEFAQPVCLQAEGQPAGAAGRAERLDGRAHRLEARYRQGQRLHVLAGAGRRQRAGGRRRRRHRARRCGQRPPALAHQGGQRR